MGGGPDSPVFVTVPSTPSKPAHSTSHSDDSDAMPSPPTSTSTSPAALVHGPTGTSAPGHTSRLNDTSDERMERGSEGKTKLVYSKSKTYIHPGARDSIPGFLAIVSQDSVYLLAWISEDKLRTDTSDWSSYVKIESGSTSEAPSSGEECSEPDSLLIDPIPTAASDHSFSVPLTSIYSIIAHPPTLSSWHGSLTINLVGGHSLPTLFFHDDESPSTVFERDARSSQLSRPSTSTSPNPSGKDLAASWGGEAVLNRLRAFAHILRSSHDPSLFLIHPSRADVEAHSSSSQFEDLSALAETPYVKRSSILHQSLGPASRSSRPSRPDRPSHRHSSSVSSSSGQSPAMNDITFSVFSAFSKITRSARTAAQDVLSHRLARPILPLLPAPVTNFAHARPEWYFQGREPGTSAGGSAPGGGFEYDGARVYLAKWAKIVAEEGEKARRAEILSGAAWSKEDSSLGGSFEILASNFHIDPPKSIRAPNQPIEEAEWHAWFDSDGRSLLNESEARRRVFQRGLAENARRQAWPFLLGVYGWASSEEERKAVDRANRERYERDTRKWTDDAELRGTEAFAREYHLIDIDCRRTDRNHPMFSGGVSSPDGQSPTNEHVIRMAGILLTWVLSSDLADSGYGQGMNDFAAPLYVVAEGDEALCYAMFDKVMQGVVRNFSRDGKGIAEQLGVLGQLIMLMDPELYTHLEKADAVNMFLCYRWCVVRLRREFPFNDLLRIWDAIFTNQHGPNFHLFISFAILRLQRDVIIRYLQSQDEILKYVNDLSGTLNVDATLEEADVAAQTFRAIVEKIEESGSPSEGTKARRELVQTLRPMLCPSPSESSKNK